MLSFFGDALDCEAQAGQVPLIYVWCPLAVIHRKPRSGNHISARICAPDAAARPETREKPTSDTAASLPVYRGLTSLHKFCIAAVRGELPLVPLGVRL
jgi:hypothetical protein